MGIGTLGGGDSFEVRLENSLYKNSEYESQTKKMIQIVIQLSGSLYLYLCIIIFHDIYSPTKK